MNRSGIPWFLVIIALLGWQVGGSGSPATKGAAPATPTVEAPAPEQPVVKLDLGCAEDQPWPELCRALAEFFGRKPASGQPSDLIAIALAAEYQPPDVYIALVPDPLDSFLPVRFDQVLAGIQEGFAEQDFLLDRIELPWTAAEAKNPDPVYRSKPGILLFRRPGVARNGRLAMVFLVGETSKQGVHKRALALALETARGFAGAHSVRQRSKARGPVDAPDPGRIRILGPTFSGSRESLRLAFTAWQDVQHQGESLPEVWLVSGSATSDTLQLCAFDCVRRIRFFRTVMDDDILLREGFHYMVETLGWARSRIALLTEADTGYGLRARAGQRDEQDDASGVGRPGKKKKQKPEMLVLKFPSGLSGLRKASEDAARGQTKSAEAPRLGPSALAISLADESRPVDVVPEFSSLTTPTKDMALSNLLAVLCGEDKSYLGLVASDSRDQIFLAERVREICPDTQLFLLASDLLLAHPQHRDAMDGAIVLSSSPLFTRGLPWLEPDSSEHQFPNVRQFQSELHEGVVHAIGALIADAERPAAEEPASLVPPSAWVSAISNGSIWPLAQLPAERMKTSASAGAPSVKANALAVTCLLALIALSFWLTVVARPLRRIPDLPGGLRNRGPFLLALATILIAWGILLVVGGLPFWAFGKTWDAQEAMTHRALAAGIVFALASCALFYLRDDLPKRFPGIPRLATSVRALAIVCAAIAAGGLLAEPLLHYWMAGGVELFHFRTRKFTGGLSPVVSLAWLGGAFFLWAILEMERRTLVVFQGSEFPICPREGEDPVFPSCREIGAKLKMRMERTSPSWHFWAVLGPPLVGAGCYLYSFIQPVAESRPYGWAFAFLAIGAFLLAAVSFHRFLALWAELAKMLERIEPLGLEPTFRSLAPEVEWRPMKSFGWQIPPFKMTELSIEKLPDQTEREALRKLLAHALEGHRQGDPAAEKAARADLQKHFDTALGEGADWDDPALRTFAALRLVAFLRTLFAHLRNSLLSALVPGFLLLIAISTYQVQPKRLLFLSIWSALAVAVLATIWTFVQIDRNRTLSAIGGTTAGEVEIDGVFVRNVLTYGVLPLLGLVASRFPQLGHLLSGYLNPLVRVVGGGGG